ncbi:MAG: TaqI family restriction endonuclease [Candidatus Micrarchaeia archaeon]
MEKNKKGIVMSRDWKEDKNKYEEFLQSIDIQKYAYLKTIKTVEQDLPREILPLEIYYEYYWEKLDFKDYDEIFKIYWSKKLEHICEFIKKYFYGCSFQFVEEGFKSRMYRIWMSILTQFHFQYLWNAMFQEKIESNPELDMKGIDALVTIENKNVGIQVKKVSFRREASQRRFTKRQQNLVDIDIIVEIPYLVIDVDSINNKISSQRTKEKTKRKYQEILKVFEKNFIRYGNGFVVFKEEYLKNIYRKIKEKIKEDISQSEIPKIVKYDDILTLPKF